MAGINLRAPNIVSICVDSIEGREMNGRLSHRYSADPIVFLGISSLLSRMEHFFDMIRFPQASMETRTFLKKDSSARRQDDNELVQVLSVDDLSSLRGEKATFIVHVQYRQNATWQGNIYWIERDVTRTFRSALEFLKLLDSTIDEIN